MSKLNYTQVERAIAERVPFTGNSCRGVLDYDGAYIVYSYSTPIAQVFDGKYSLNARKYSVTTSRLQNIIRRAWANNNVIEGGI